MYGGRTFTDSFVSTVFCLSKGAVIVSDSPISPSDTDEEGYSNSDLPISLSDRDEEGYSDGDLPISLSDTYEEGYSDDDPARPI